jgi:hypothetical protein
MEYDCSKCGLYDPDYGCTCSSLDEWYQCPLEPEPTEKDFQKDGD